MTNPKYTYTPLALPAMLLSMVMMFGPFVAHATPWFNIMPLIAYQIIFFGSFAVGIAALTRYRHEEDIDLILDGQRTTDGYRLHYTAAKEAFYVDGIWLKTPHKNEDGTYTAKP